MKILLIDTMSGYLDFALRCEAHGHEVRWFTIKMPNGDRSTVGDGLVKRVDDWHPSMKWADIIITSDNTKFMKELDGWRARGYPVFGCTEVCAAWELERDIGQEVLMEHGIECLPSIRFNNYDEAIAYTHSNPDKRFVSKPLGDADKALSYVSKSCQDLMFMLQHWKRTMHKASPFIFQEFTPGIEVAVGGWFGKNGFSEFFLENFEHKKLMNDEVGVNTGEMGTVLKYATLEESALAQEMLVPLIPTLIRCGYTGYIDVAVIIDEKGCAWPLEFTCRQGWPLFQIQQVLHPDPVEWMKDLLNGKDTFTPYGDVAVGVVVAMPDFPYGKMKVDELSDFPVWGITDKNRYWIHPCDMKLGAGPVLEGGKIKDQAMLVTAGNYVMVVTGAAPTVSKAQEIAYEHLGQLEIPNSPMYRTDIGSRVKEQLPKLQALGYFTSWRW